MSIDPTASDQDDLLDPAPLDAAGTPAFDPSVEAREMDLDRATRFADEHPEPPLLPPSSAELPDEGQGDASMILEPPQGPAEPMAVTMRWDAYASAHHIGIELKHLEDTIRDLLEPIDPRRKRKFSGTRRWHELEDDLRAMRFSGRVPETTIAQILQLVAKRHTLYRRLSFLSSTRPTWNT